MKIYFNDSLDKSSELYSIFQIEQLRNLYLPNNPFKELQNIVAELNLEAHYLERPDQLYENQYIWIDLVRFQNFSSAIEKAKKTEAFVIYTYNSRPVCIVKNGTTLQPELIELEEVLDLNSLNIELCVRHFHTQSRNFNRIDFKENRVVKKSNWFSKMEGEANFYNNIPETLKKYYPNFYHKNLAQAQPEYSYEIGLIEKFDLAVYYLNGLVTPSFLKSVLECIQNYFEICPKLKTDCNDVKRILQELLITKCRQRVTQFLHDSPHFMNSKVIIKNHSYTLVEYTNLLADNISSEIQSCENTFLHFSHGDLVFSNILVSNHKPINLHFIDPRGGLDLKDFHLPLLYDLAKLSQCIMGSYHQTLNGVGFENFELKEIFANWLKQFNYNLQFVWLSEASLYLSLLPLHTKDNQLLNQFIEHSVSAYLRADSGSLK